jgi:hypothetical protein
MTMDDLQWLKDSLDEIKDGLRDCSKRLNKLEIDFAGMKVKTSLLWVFIGAVIASLGAAFINKA